MRNEILRWIFAGCVAFAAATGAYQGGTLSKTGYGIASLLLVGILLVRLLLQKKGRRGDQNG
jgi:hypothetical protein